MLSPPAWGPHTACHGLVSQGKGRGWQRQAGAPSSTYIQGVIHAQQKHFQFPEYQWTITVRRPTHRGNMRAHDGAKAYWSITIHSHLAFSPTSLHAAAFSKPHMYLELPTANHSSLCNSPLLACHPVKWRKRQAVIVENTSWRV